MSLFPIDGYHYDNIHEQSTNYIPLKQTKKIVLGLGVTYVHVKSSTAQDERGESPGMRLAQDTFNSVNSSPSCTKFFGIQWTLTYPALSYPEYSVIWPRSLHILFNAHAAYGAK